MLQQALNKKNKRAFIFFFWSKNFDFVQSYARSKLNIEIQEKYHAI